MVSPVPSILMLLSEIFFHAFNLVSLFLYETIFLSLSSQNYCLNIYLTDCKFKWKLIVQHWTWMSMLCNFFSRSVCSR